MSVLNAQRKDEHMANLTREQMKLLDEHARAQQEMMREQLERIGVQFRIAGPFEGDSSYPMEYHLRYSFVSVVAPTFDLAISAFIEALLKHVPVEKALEQHGGECRECGRTVTALNSAGMCEGCVRQAQIDAIQENQY
jgi:ribosomal protein S14